MACSGPLLLNLETPAETCSAVLPRDVLDPEELALLFQGAVLCKHKALSRHSLLRAWCLPPAGWEYQATSPTSGGRGRVPLAAALAF